MRTFFLKYILFFVLLLAGFPVAAQKKNVPKGTKPGTRTGAKKDLFKVKAPKIQYVRPDTSILIEYDEFPEESSDADKSIYFNPAKQLSIVSEDTSTLNMGEQEIVEVSEQVLIDTTWIKVAGYYTIWDSNNINPYRKDGRQLKDTINLKLTDPVKQRFSKMPLEKTPVTSSFGFRGYRWHYGTDIDLNTGDTIYAAFDGVIRISKWDGGGYGNYIVVRHYNGLETLYGHMSRPLVLVGTFVKAGDPIGLGGSTGRSSGPHLHYEVRYEGNPIDPSRLYDFPDYKLKSEEFAIMASLFNYYNTAARHKATSSARRVMYHKVRSGDTLSGIARKYHTSVSALTKLNRITPTTTLKLGRSLRVK